MSVRYLVITYIDKQRHFHLETNKCLPYKKNLIDLILHQITLSKLCQLTVDRITEDL